MSKPKYSNEQIEFVQKHLISCEIPRDSLPYHKQFDTLYREYKKSGLPNLEKHDFWKLISRAGKKGGARQPLAKKLPTVVISQEERYEMIRLFPSSIGSRDRLPYTTEFDSIYEKFLDHTGRKLTRNEFWRALAKTAKATRKPSAIDVNPSNTISDALVHQLHLMNPWWKGDVPLNTPPFKRHIFDTLYPKLTDYRGGHKPFLGVRGPRQVGKSTIMEQLIQKLLYDIRLVQPNHVLRVQFDVPGMQLENPILTIVRWFEESIAQDSFNNLWKQKTPVFLFFDEVQDVIDWNVQLKAIADFQMCKALITGSSALHLLKGRESLPGRLDTYNLNPLSLSEVGQIQGFDQKPFPRRKRAAFSDMVVKDYWIELGKYNNLFLDDAFKSYCDLGGYPYCHVEKEHSLAERNNFLKNNVTLKMIDHDLGVGMGRGTGISQLLQNRTLLRNIFIILCKFTGRDIGIGTLHTEIEKSCGASVKHDQIHEVLKIFDDSMLIKILRPSQHRYAGAKTQLKPCLCDHAIRAAWLAEEVPLYGDTPNEDIAGHIVEGMVGYLLASIDGMNVSYLPAKKEQGEIDYLVEIGDKHIPIEVKYRKNIPKLDALEDYLSKSVHNAPFGIVITKDDFWVRDQIVAIPFKKFLLLNE